MRTITTIGDKNASYFEPLLAGISDGEGIVRLGLIEDGQAVAALAATVSEADADLMHLFVREDRRRQGAGTYLLEGFITAMADAGMEGISACYPNDEVMDGLLASEGFLVLPGDELCVADVDAFLASPQVRKLRDQNTGEDRVREYASLSEAEQAGLQALLSQEGLTPEDLTALDPDGTLSAVILSGTHVTGAILVQREKEMCMVEYLCTEKGANAADLRLLIIRLIKNILKDPGIRQLCFYAAEEKLLTFVEKLAGDPARIRHEVRTSTASLVLE